MGKNQKEIPEMKTSIIQIKNSIENVHSEQNKPTKYQALETMWTF